MEGRPVAREMAGGRAARVARPSQRPAPHHLQDRRRALASRAQEPGPDDARGPAQGEYRRRGAALGAWAADRPAGGSPDIVGDFRWRAGGWFHAVGHYRGLYLKAAAVGDCGRKGVVWGKVV